MLATTSKARTEICLLSLANPCENVPVNCEAEACSAWRWAVEEFGSDGCDRLGYCGLVGRMEFSCRYLKDKKKAVLRSRAA